MSYSIGFDIFAKDRASDTFDKLGKKVGDTDKKFSKSTAAIGIGVAAAGVAITKFAGDSIAAFGEAEKSQRVLTDAYGRFPKLADVSIGSLRDLAAAQQTKTKFDGDEVAAAMGTLAQYKITGKQLKELTPLMLDYAQKTGKDLPEAAKGLGMAMMGNARALKEVGINIPKTADAAKTLGKAQDKAAAAADKLKDAQGKLADTQEVLRGKSKLTVQDHIKLRNAHKDVEEAAKKNESALKFVSTAQAAAGKTGGKFAEIVGGLRKQVGGFAEKEGLSAEGRAAILKNKFGDLQETVGSKLQPKLEKLTDAGIKVVDWMSKNEGTVKTLGTAIGVLVVGIGSIVAITKVYTAVQTALNVVMAMNPIGLVVVAIALLAAGLVIAYQKSETFRKVVDGVFNGIKVIIGNVVSVIVELFRKMLSGWTTVVGGILSAAATVAEKLGLPFAKGLRAASDSFNTTAATADKKLKEIADSASHWGEQAPKNLAAGINKGRPLVLTAAGNLARDTQAKMLFNVQPTGAAVSAGFARGINAGRPAVLTAAGNLARDAQERMNSVLKIQSPSKVMEQIGRYVGQGLVVGMDSQRGNVGSAAASMAGIPGTLAGRGGSPAIGGGGGGVPIIITVNGALDPNAVAQQILTMLQRLKGSGTNLGLV